MTKAHGRPRSGSNQLDPGDSRLGWLFDGDEKSPHAAAQLHDDGSQITIKVSWVDGHESEYYRPWFLSQFGDSNVGNSSRIPQDLQFLDVKGPVALVGCRGWGMSFGSVGQGTVRAEGAVLGGGVAYGEINGLRADMPALASWFSMGRIDPRISDDDEGRVVTLDLHVVAPPPTPLSSRFGLQIRPTFAWQVLAGSDAATIYQTLQIETRTEAPTAWRRHLDWQNQVRDLVAIALWEATGFSALFVQRDDDPLRVESGRSVGDQWLPLHTYEAQGSAVGGGHRLPLFRFDDLPVGAIDRWLVLRDDFTRALDPFVAILETKGAVVENALSLAGITVDALGHLIASKSGLDKRTIDSLSIASKIRIVADVAGGLPAAADCFPDVFARAYNSMKHVKRSKSSLECMAASVLGAVILVRQWVAIELGVAPETIRRRTEGDAVVRDFRRYWDLLSDEERQR